MREEARTPSDVIAKCIGNCGRWQFGVSILMGFLKFSLAWSQFGIVFFAPPIKFRCSNSTEPFSNHTSENEFGVNECVVVRDNSTIECTQFEFDQSVFKSTIATEWNLVCSRAFLVEITQMTFMAGFLIGSMIFGISSDKYGRRKSLLVAIVVQIISSFGIAFSPWFTVFLAARFVSSLASGGLSVISFVLCMETFGGKWKTIMPILYHAPLGIGNALMAGLAYLLRDWRNLQISLSTLTTLYITYIWLIPESPRWLLATNRNKEAIDVLKKAAIVNGRNPDMIKSLVTNNKIDEPIVERGEFKAILKSRDFKLKTLILCIEWFGGGIGVFAFIQNVGNISSNIFIVSIILGLNVIPGMPLCIYLGNKFARKKVIGGAQLFSAFCFVVILLVPRGVFTNDWPRILFSAFSIIGIDVFIAMLYVYTAEIYPTVVRNAAIGGVTVASRFGSMLAPLILSLDKISPMLPLSTLAILMVTLTLCLIPLPEIKRNILEDPMQSQKITLHE